MKPRWGLLTNHALVLVYVVRNSHCTVREISAAVGVTERATLAILRQLGEEGFIIRRRDGRRNIYTVDFDRLASYRRELTVKLAPRPFVDALIEALLEISDGGDDGAHPTDPVDSGALDPYIGTASFMTNHALLLLAIANDNVSTVREMAASIGVTERAVVAILNQLEAEGVIERRREGRRNSYRINFEGLSAFPRWSTGQWPLPEKLITVAVHGLRDLADDNASW